MSRPAPHVVVFACNWCAYTAADLAGTTRLHIPAGFTVIRVMCSGRVDPVHVLRALVLGADAVVVAGCHRGDCHYTSGNLHAERRVDFLAALLARIGLAGRLEMHHISAAEGQRFQEVIGAVQDRVAALGPSPLRAAAASLPGARREAFRELLSIIVTELDLDPERVAAIEDLPVDPLNDDPAGFTEDQRDQPGGFTGDPDVFDTWATSSLTPQVATKWYKDPARHENLFPMDIRPQSHEIIRTWAFYTIVKAYLHTGEIPWRNVVISGWILDPDRKKMSKSQGNVVTPEPLLDEFGADSVRYWAARARLGVDTAYDEQVFKTGKRLCTKLFNASKFVIGRFADIDPAQLGPDKIVAESDRAVIAQLRPLIERATAAFDQFDYAQALGLVEDFFWRTFCDNYLELAKGRTYEDELTAGRLSAASTLRLIHRVLVRMMAPYLPFLTEEVWHWCYTGDAGMHESVHRSPWPALDEIAAIPAPGNALTYPASVGVIEAVRKAKAEASQSMKAPISQVTVTAKADAIQAVQSALDDLKGMLHIEQFEFAEGTPEAGLVAVDVQLTT